MTWRLIDGLPRECCFTREALEGGKAFAAFDRLLDNTRTGNRWLAIPEVAEIVVATIKSADVDLHGWVVMPNRVHILTACSSSVDRTMQSIKGRSALAANRSLNRSGPFWQAEYFDRVVRDRTEFAETLNYIENNPVRVGLAPHPGTYRFSSCGLE